MNPETAQAFQAIEDASKLHICLKIMKYEAVRGTVLAELSQHRNIHVTEFCNRVKLTRNEQCKQCDLNHVPARCEQERGIFHHTCHAGGEEFIVPVFAGDVLVALVYIGQFRMTRNNPHGLPYLNAAAMERVHGLAALLRSYLLEQLQTPTHLSETSRGYRGAAIHSFLKQNIKSNPDLGDLANFLRISKARAGHAVREATGQTFVDLRDSFRVDRARNLLAGTYFKVTHIASECGFASSHYFHRFFLRKTGMTPLRYRQMHRAEA